MPCQSWKSFQAKQPMNCFCVTKAQREREFLPKGLQTEGHIDGTTWNDGQKRCKGSPKAALIAVLSVIAVFFENMMTGESPGPGCGSSMCVF